MKRQAAAGMPVPGFSRARKKSLLFEIVFGLVMGKEFWGYPWISWHAAALPCRDGFDLRG